MVVGVRVDAMIILIVKIIVSRLKIAIALVLIYATPILYLLVPFFEIQSLTSKVFFFVHFHLHFFI